MKTIISLFIFCAVGIAAFGQMSKIEYTHHGDTTFIKYLRATTVFTIYPRSYGDYKVMEIDTIVGITGYTIKDGVIMDTSEEIIEPAHHDSIPFDPIPIPNNGYFPLSPWPMPGMPHEGRSPDYLPYNIDNLEGVYHSDTLEITDTAIHFIKIGDKVYEIKRSAEIVPVAPLPKQRKITLRDGEVINPSWRNAMPSVQLYNLQN